MSIIGEIIGQLFTELLIWFERQLPKPLRIGCWTILGAAIIAVVILAFME